MMGFVIPLRAAEDSTDWGRECRLLQRTIGSLTGQTVDQLRVYVVCQDEPMFLPADDRVSWIKYPHGYLTYEKIEDWDTYASKHYTQLWAERTFDQGKKCFYGCAAALADGCTYLHSVDGDDLISARLVEAVLAEPEVGCWFAEKGYNFTEGTKSLRFVSENMADLTGSGNIVRSDLVRIPDLQSSKLWDFNLFAAHGWTRSRVPREHDVHSKALPFPAVIAVSHGGNWSDTAVSLSTAKKVKKFAKHILQSILMRTTVTPQIRDEFNLYPI